MSTGGDGRNGSSSGLHHRSVAQGEGGPTFKSVTRPTFNQGDNPKRIRCYILTCISNVKLIFPLIFAPLVLFFFILNDIEIGNSKNSNSEHGGTFGYIDGTAEKHAPQRAYQNETHKITQDVFVRKSAHKRSRPANWKSIRHSRLLRHFECREAFAEKNRPWWSDEEFHNVRHWYRVEFARANREGTHQLSDDTTFESSHNAVPFQTGDGKGRGLKAARHIERGEIVLKATNNTIVFTSGLTFRKFLFELNEMYPTFACDVMIWAWAQDLDDKVYGAKVGVSVDLNNNNLINQGNTSNVRCGNSIEECSKSMTFYARKDIKEGEELLCDYGEFVSSHSLWGLAL